MLSPGKSHGQRCLVGYSPWGRKESDRTERLHFTLVTISLFLVSVSVLWISSLASCFKKLDSTYEWYHVFVFLYQTYCSKTVSRFIHVLQTALFHSFLWLSIIPLCVCIYIYVPHLLYLFLSQWTFSLPPFLPLVIVLLWTLGACIFSNHGFVRIYAQEWTAGSHGSTTFSFLRNLHTGSP